MALLLLVMALLSLKVEVPYDLIRGFLKRFETKGQHPDDLKIQAKVERIGIFDMGRAGVATSRVLQVRLPSQVI